VAQNQIKTISPKHDAIMDALIASPHLKLGEIAVQFGVSQAWLSVIIHSDAFQIQLKTKQKEFFGAVVVPLREKLIGVAHLGVDKLGEVMENASTLSDKQFIADTTDSILKNLGYSPKSVPPPLAGSVKQQNVFVVDKETLESARETMRQLQPPEGGALIEHESAHPPAEEI
jgi:hypothetical protein